MFGFGLTKIKLDLYPGIIFYPFHQVIRKENENMFPVLKSIQIGKYEFHFFRVNYKVYIVKPTKENDHTKWLVTEVFNSVTKNSAESSITGHCSRSVKKEFIDFSARLINSNLSEEEIFLNLVK